MKSTIDVGGVDRPIKNDKGQPIHPTKEGVINFWKWFKDSKAVDDQGKPQVVYHGTGENFNVFKTRGEGAYFTTNKEAALDYGDRVMAAYLSIRNPCRVSAQQWNEGGVTTLSPEQARAEGYDGYIIEDQNIGGGSEDEDTIFSTVGDTYIAFFPEQIKSATGNNGDFDPTNPDITK